MQEFKSQEGGNAEIDREFQSFIVVICWWALQPLPSLQILVMLEATEEVNVEGVVQYVTSLQNEDGSFSGDKWGEVDTRFSFCAVACLALLVGLSLSLSLSLSGGQNALHLLSSGLFLATLSYFQWL